MPEKHPLLNECQQHLKNLVDFCVSGDRYTKQNPYTIEEIRDAVNYLYSVCKEDKYRLHYPNR
jgi:hypothetical protein